jgi:hypothetical protein
MSLFRKRSKTSTGAESVADVIATAEDQFIAGIRESLLSWALSHVF